ncbi:MAG: T9SS type A sorting domain-containing protein [Chitinophagales bacterium]
MRKDTLGFKPYNKVFQYFTAGDIYTRRCFPTGDYEIRFKIPYIQASLQNPNHFDFAPLWLLSSLGIPIGGQMVFYYQEIDIEFGLDVGKSTSLPRLSYHHQPPNIDSVKHDCTQNDYTSCGNGFNVADGQFHKMNIVWDEYAILWFIDDQLFRGYFRTYDFASLPVSECTGAEYPGPHIRNNGFPTFTDMNIHSGSGVFNDAHNAWPAGATELTMEIDYIKAFKRINCNKIVNLTDYKSAGLSNWIGSSTPLPKAPPTEAKVTPSVITGGIINVAGSGNTVVVERDSWAYWVPRSLDLLASTEINLLPGFSTNIQPKDLEGADQFNARIVACPNGNSNKRSNEYNYEEVINSIRHSSQIQFEDFANESNSDKSFFWRIAPNPIVDKSTIFVSTPYTEVVEISVFDVEGRQIESLFQGLLVSGNHQIDLPQTSLPKGIYYIRYKSFNFNHTIKISVIH